MLRLFVSHSSKNPSARDFLCKITSALQSNKNGWTVLVDKSGDLYPSSDWELRLYEWLAECHAAVILVNKDALESWWVQKEATILKWRWRIDCNFEHLFIVLMDDLQAEVFQQERFKVLNLTQVQFLTDHDNDPTKIVALIEKQLETITSANTSFDEMQAAISDSLSRVSSNTLIRACQKIQVESKLGESIMWTGSDNVPRAEALARLVLRENKSSLKTFNDLLNAIKPPVSGESAAWLYDTIHPLWICEEAAALLPLGLIDAELSNRIAVNGNRLYRFTADSLVRRAYPMDDDWVLIPIDKTKTDVKTIADEVRKHFREHITWDSSASNAETDREIRSFTPHIYILLPENVSDDHILDQLQTLYPNAEFLLSVGVEMPPAEALPANVIPLKPALDIHLEERQNNEMNRARNLLSKLPGGPRR